MSLSSLLFLFTSSSSSFFFCSPASNLSERSAQMSLWYNFDHWRRLTLRKAFADESCMHNVAACAKCSVDVHQQDGVGQWSWSNVKCLILKREAQWRTSRSRASSHLLSSSSCSFILSFKRLRCNRLSSGVHCLAIACS